MGQCGSRVHKGASNEESNNEEKGEQWREEERTGCIEPRLRASSHVRLLHRRLLLLSRRSRSGGACSGCSRLLLSGCMLACEIHDRGIDEIGVRVAHLMRAWLNDRDGRSGSARLA